MSLTAVITNHDYARYLPQCLESATKFCDEVLVYDDGSTDDSLEVIESFGITPVCRKDASGSPVWGSNLGIEDAQCTHIIWLDSDNWLTRRPPENDADYTFAPIRISPDDTGWFINVWEYPDWPLTAEGCLAKFDRERTIPVPWGGVWRTEFVKPLRWRHWETTQFAADFRTCLDWVQHGPTLRYDPTPFLVFRTHEGQWSDSPERVLMEAEARAFPLG